MMLKQSPRRNQRKKGIKVKHVVQISLVLGVCVWLLYQVQHKKLSVEKTKIAGKMEEEGSNSIKLGGKDLQPSEDEKLKEDEAAEQVHFDDENKPDDQLGKTAQEGENERTSADGVKGSQEAEEEDGSNGGGGGGDDSVNKADGEEKEVDGSEENVGNERDMNEITGEEKLEENDNATENKNEDTTEEKDNEEESNVKDGEGNRGQEEVNKKDGSTEQPDSSRTGGATDGRNEGNSEGQNVNQNVLQNSQNETQVENVSLTHSNGVEEPSGNLDVEKAGSNDSPNPTESGAAQGQNIETSTSRGEGNNSETSNDNGSDSTGLQKFDSGEDDKTTSYNDSNGTDAGESKLENSSDSGQQDQAGSISTIPQEEKEARTDLDTLPQGAEATNHQATAE